MSPLKIIVVGGGVAGFFAAITAAETNLAAEVTVLERGPQFLTKVRISGGGRCNVTHDCFDPREFAKHYPRGSQALIGAFQKFQARDTVLWFAARGVNLKTESDGRMFPTTDSSQTIVDCLLGVARAAGVKLRTNCGVESVRRTDAGGFELKLSAGEVISCNRLLLATGGCRLAVAGQFAVALGHTLMAPVPSLFTFQVETPWLRELAGMATSAEVFIPNAKLVERGPVLVTHWGLSGPAILRLSAWGARQLHALDYRFPLLVNWLPAFPVEKILKEFSARREKVGARLVVNVPIAPLPTRLWAALLLAAGIPHEARWASLSRTQQHQLAQQLTRTEFAVTGKSLNRDEFVTCGGVKLGEVDFKTMQSRICPGLFFAGELLDIDGITGGFNFQAAWTTGWLAGRGMVEDQL